MKGMMTFPRFLYAPHFAMEERAMCAFFAKALDRSDLAKEKDWDRDGGDWKEDAEEVEEYLLSRGYVHRPRHEGRVAVIPVKGVMWDRTENAMIEAWYGACSMEKISEWIEEAVADAGVSGIVLDVDSPGGMCLGCADLALVVEAAAARKPLIAQTSGMMCSAAIYACAGARAIYSSTSAVVGSIGVISQVPDLTKYFEKWGVSWNTFTSGPLKGTGAPGTSLTKAQAEYLQNGVDALAQDFKAWISQHRQGVTSDSMEGGAYYGKEAFRRRLTDGFGTLAEAVRDVMRM